MAKTLKDLPVGSIITHAGATIYNKPIRWMKLEDNHYGMNETTLIAKDIIKHMCVDAKEPGNSDSDRGQYGNNRYIHSNIHQWLNSDKTSWYSDAHSSDQAPNKSRVWLGKNPYDNIPGFMNAWDQDFKEAILNTSLKVVKSSTDGGGMDTFNAKVFCLSGAEAGLGDESGADGTPFSYFDSNSRRKAVPTADAKANNDDSDYDTTWWLRTSKVNRSHYVHCVEDDGSLFFGDAYLGRYGVRPALNFPSSISISEKGNGEYELTFNTSPEISGIDTNLGEKNQPFEIQYSVEDKDITDNVTITEHLNNSLIRRITNANNTEQTLKITSELLNSCPLGETNTIKIYAEDDKDAGTYRNYWFKRTNTPPYFVEENMDLGTVTKAPTITFTAKDDDGDKYLKAKVKINQRVVKTYEQLGNGEQVSFTLDWKDFMQLHHSRKHNLWVEVEDSSGALATLKYTFERDTKKIEIATNTAPLDIKVKLMVFNANIKLGEGATFLQYACNDFGTKNTWEKIENGVPHEFTNKHEGEDVIGYKCELTKGTGESEIRSIGGSFI